jgi:hypothetical protein
MTSCGNDWLTALISGAFALLGVFVGAAATQGTAWWQRHRRRKGHWRAMKAEVEHNRLQAQVYVEAGVGAPAYRLIKICYDNGFPPLLADGVLSTDDTQAVLRFYDLVDQMNYCLDEAAEHTKTAKVSLPSRVTDRALLKAQQVADRTGTGAYSRIMAVIAHHLK